jgi:A/G-specific adenine glycosylase
MSFTATILQWFRENGRALPWRATRDPYLIWLSEIILQQTRIEQGRPYWERFVHRWPDVASLAAAQEDEVLREWQGLGYYSRARNLHEAARQIVARGSFPSTLEEIKTLKGVGDYTAAAIASIAFGLPAAVVDGNVYRVLSRHYGIRTPINSSEGKKEFAALAQSLLPAKEASAFNQAMMDFGAVQCTPQHPDCLSCPLQESCVALREQSIGQLPVKLKKLTVKERRLTYVYIRCQGETAIHRRAAGDIWQGLYEPWLTDEVPPGAILLRSRVKHVLTHRVLYADFWLWETTSRPPLPADYQWIPEAETDHYAVPRLVEIMLNEIKKRVR